MDNLFLLKTIGITEIKVNEDLLSIVVLDCHNYGEMVTRFYFTESIGFL